jgi:hypothetical protein
MLELHRHPIRLSRYEGQYGIDYSLDVRVPVGFGPNRKRAWIKDDDLEYQIRVDGYNRELVLEEETLATAIGTLMKWDVSTDRGDVEINQRSFGETDSSVLLNGSLVGRIWRSSRFPTRVESDLASDWHPVIEAFITVVAIGGWREVDASMYSAAPGGG